VRNSGDAKEVESMEKGRHIETGRSGEEQARHFLASQGYSIVETNYRVSRGEIDIIARHRSDIVFIEVKTRRDGKCGTPAEAVSWRKRRQIRNLAMLYLQRKGLTDIPYRFDVVAITLRGNTIQLIQGAF
jgi:putative endonuclease